MVFLPKAKNGEVGEASNTRPLNITNGDNRILANAVRYRLEPIMEQWITKEQRGFLGGRSLIHNVVEIDTAMAEQALQSSEGAAILFDFRAAFPSVIHTFLTDALKHLGLPKGMISFVEALYHNNFCDILLSGSRMKGFELKCGIRQGCPLSPLIFAICSDLILRRIKRLCKGVCHRAFADDLAAVSEDLLRDLPTFSRIFSEYGLISGLELNWQISSFMPLGLEPLERR